MNIIAKYWARLRFNERDAQRLSRSFWLQFAANRFPDIKNAGELIGVAQQFYDWQFNGVAAPAEARVIDGRSPARAVE